MNYRHAYHAGNFADIMKHLALTMVLDHLKKKETGFCAIDAHGGIGLYDLLGEQAQKTGEWEAGIGRFETLKTVPEDFAPYFDFVRPYLQQKRYPGSPVIIAHALRDQDRLIANELHPDDLATLQSTLKGFGNVRITHLDAYECVRAQIPPKEKRGVILIDPPFEKTDEFQTLIRQISEWKKRFAQGIYMIWYPVKAHLAVDALKQAAVDLNLPRTWCYETLLHPARQPETFNGSGLIMFNAPYQVPERLEGLLPFLTQHLKLHETTHQWLTPA